MGSQARQYSQRMNHFIRSAALLFNDPLLIGAGKVIGHVPANSRIINLYTFVDVAFNAGSSNVFNIGAIPEVQGVPTAAPNGQSNLLAASAAGAVASLATKVPVALMAPATDLELVAQVVMSGTPATAGQLTVILEYFPPPF